MELLKWAAVVLVGLFVWSWLRNSSGISASGYMGVNPYMTPGFTYPQTPYPGYLTQSPWQMPFTVDYQTNSGNGIGFSWGQ